MNDLDYIIRSLGYTQDLEDLKEIKAILRSVKSDLVNIKESLANIIG